MDTIENILIISALLLLSYVLNRLWGGIGQRFEPKNYEGYFNASVSSSKINNAETAAIVRISREDGRYFVRDIFLPKEGGYQRFHFGGIMPEDAQIYPLQWSRIHGGRLGEGAVWDVVITDKKPLKFKPEKEFFVD